MRYRRAVEKLRILADACSDLLRFPVEEPFLRAAYIYGDVLAGKDPLEAPELLLVVNLPATDLPWAAEPEDCRWLADWLKLDKLGYLYRFRSREDPVTNPRVREAVRFWSLDGPDDDVLQALAERRFGDLPRVVMDEESLPRQRAAELRAALDSLRETCDRYWEPDWRRAHRGHGRYPENTLWDAVFGYLELLDAAGERPDGPEVGSG